MDMVIPDCRLEGISAEAKSILGKRKYIIKSICFYGRKSIPSLALSIIAAARLLSENDRCIFLRARSEREFNNLIRYLFRVEGRTPRMVRIKSDNYYRFSFGT